MELQLYVLNVLDIIGTAVFAMSGALIAADEKYDLFGAFVISFVTALGGGTLRDILTGSLPVGWMSNTIYIYIVIGSCIVSWLFKPHLFKLSKAMFLFDTIGLGVFTVLGIQKGLAQSLAPVVVVFIGVISSVFGGILRDVLCNRTPLIFRKEIYASACFIGAILYIIGHYIGIHLLLLNIISAVSVITIRLLAVKQKWTLPRI